MIWSHLYESRVSYFPGGQNSEVKKKTCFPSYNAMSPRTLPYVCLPKGIFATTALRMKKHLQGMSFALKLRKQDACH